MLHALLRKGGGRLVVEDSQGFVQMDCYSSKGRQEHLRNNTSVGSLGKYVQECGLASTRYALVWSEETKPQGHQHTINAVTVPGETQPLSP